MKKLLIVLTATLFTTMAAKGQNLFFFGENSYPCSETFKLRSNSNSNDLDVLFVKDGTKALFVVRIDAMYEVIFSGKLIIYLDDGNVISFTESKSHDYVDGIASALYSIADEQLNIMKASNINTIRYELRRGYRNPGIGEGNFTASNKGIPTQTIITNFLENKKMTVEYSGNAAGASQGVTGGTGNQGAVTGSVDSNIYGEGTGTGTRWISYNLAGRQPTKLPDPNYDVQSEGIVVVEITVDRNGNVTQATAGVKGSTTLDEYFLRVAKEAALAAKFDAKSDAPLIQKGTITYRFILR